jgi:hypothetical protein
MTHQLTEDKNSEFNEVIGEIMYQLNTSGIKTVSSINLVRIINSLRDEGKAELRHDHFMVKIENHPAIHSPEFLGQYKDSTGRKLKCYYLPEREAKLMVMSESLQVQAAVLDELIEVKADPVRIAKQPKERDEALAKMRTAKALQMNLESAAKIYALFPHLGTQSHQTILSKIVGDNIVPLPVLEYRTYTATEVAEKLGVTANFIGRTANANGLKTLEFGIFVLDKSRSSEKQVETFRYNDKAVEILSDLIVTSRATSPGEIQ